MGYLQIVVETSPGTVMYTHNRAVTKACNHFSKQLMKLTLLTYMALLKTTTGKTPNIYNMVTQ